MKKIFIIAPVLLIVLFSGLWFYRAHVTKQFLEGRIEEIQKDGNTHITYDKMAVTGFPVAFKIEIKSLHIETKQADQAPPAVLDIPQVVVHSNVMGDAYTINMDKFSLQQEGKNERTVINIPSSTIDVTFLRSAWKDVLDGSLDFDSPVAYTYKNQGFTLANREKSPETVLANGGPTAFRFVESKDKATEIFDISFNTTVAAEKAMTDQFKTFSLAVEMQAKQAAGSNQVMADRSMDIKHFTLGVDDVTVSLKGMLQAAKTDPQPFGKIDVEISNYPKILDAAEKLDPSLDKKIVQPLLQQAANVMDGTRLAFAVSREQGKEIFIGKTAFSVLIAAYNEALQQKAAEQPKKNGE